MKKNLLIFALMVICTTLSLYFWDQVSTTKRQKSEIKVLQDSLFKKSFQKISEEKMWKYRVDSLHQMQPYP